MKIVLITMFSFVLLITSTVFAQQYSNEISEECPDDYPYLWENGICHKKSVFEYNCPVGYEEHWKKECFDSSTPEPVTMGFYENSRYDFSFQLPMNWYYVDGVTTNSGITYEMLGYPKEFALENVGDDANMMDLQMSLSGLTFQFESPLIAVNFENIPTSKVTTLSEKNLKEYVLDKIMIEQPSARIMDSWAKSNSWGWEVHVMYNYDLDLGVGSGIPYVGEETTYFFKDRESYSVEYGAPPAYFEDYRYVYDHVLETIIIKSVKVPEFGSIAMLILAVSVISVVILSRRFNLIRF